MMWLGNPFVFIAIWVAMMVAMMLAPLIPVLRRYRNPARLAAGYFLVWTMFGALAFAIGTVVVRVSQRSPAVGRATSIVLGGALAISGLIQFTGWKRRHLACCRECAPSASRGTWSDGVRLGLHCCQCCVALMALLFALGMMHLPVIILVTGLIAAERLAPRPAPVVWATGALTLIVGAVRIAQARG